MATKDERAALLAEAREILLWEQRCGAIGVPAGAKTRAELASSPARVPAEPPSTTAASRLALLSDAQDDSVHAGAPTAPPLGDRVALLAALESEARVCTRCSLHQARTQSVFARGSPAAQLVFVGEGPGQEEDRSGLPFVGPAGQLLDKMIAAMGFARDDVYICNIVKCRPPNNRTPVPEEARACEPFLTGQISAVAPRVIVALGRCAAENMGLVPSSGGWRGRWGKYRGIDVMPTYHPAFLLRSPEFKRPVWEDLQAVMAKLRAAS